MSLRLQDLRAKIATAHNLHGVVETMRGLAAVNIRRAEAAADSGATYARTVHLALHVALHHLSTEVLQSETSTDQLPAAALIITSDQGLCGQFNDRVVTEALARARGGWVRPQAPATSTAGDPVYEREPLQTETHWIVVGLRGLEQLSASGQRITGRIDAPGSVEAIPKAVQQAVLTLGHDVASGQTGRLFIVYTELEAGTPVVKHRQLTPFQPSRWLEMPFGEAPWGTLPQMAGDIRDALPRLVKQHVYIDLFQAFAQSFAAENAARLASMQSAAENIEERLLELEAAYRRERQDVITAELMDLINGVEAVR